MIKNDDTLERNRIYFLDNLRTFIIFLVVLFHAGWVYEPSGFLSSVWIVDDPLKNNFSGIINMIVDIFMMPTMFFISGYFTTLSLKNKNGWIFLKSRFKRLILPWIIAVLTLLPLYKVIFLISRNLPQENLASYLYFSGDILINQGWLWFLPVLFLFDLIYYVLSRFNPLRLNLNFKRAVLTVFLIGLIYSFCMSYFHYYGWTKTILLDFQNEKLLVYFLMFLLGSLGYKQNIFTTKATNKTLYYVICFTIWIPMNVYIIFLLNLIFNPNNPIFSRIVDNILVWFGFHLSLLGLLYIVINTFRYYLNKKGKYLRKLNEYSYGVYILHFIVMGGIAFILLNTTIPSMAKYIILTISTFVISNLIIYFYKDILLRNFPSLRQLK
jgi:fucose 4-O-acetylase-like acetyltransferase